MAKKKPKKLDGHQKAYLLTLLKKNPDELTDAERNTIVNFSQKKGNKKDFHENKDESLSGFMNKKTTTLSVSERTSSTIHSQKRGKRNRNRHSKGRPNIVK